MSTPVAANDSYTTNEDTALTVAAVGLLGNDSDADGDQLHAILVSAPSHGQLTWNGDGAFTYTPAANFNGTDSFTYKANDGAADSNTGTVTINVAAVNDAPRPTPILRQVFTAEEVAVGGQLTAVDVENDPFTFSPEFTPQHGSVTVEADGTWTYTPDADFNGTDTFSYLVTDDEEASGVGEVSIIVTPINDAPVAVNDQYNVDEDGTLVVSVGAVSRLHMISDPGDFVGQGLTWDFSPATAAFSAGVNFDSGVSLRIDPPGVLDEWFMDFAAPNEVQLSPGEYLDATRFPFQTAGEPGLNVFSAVRGNNQLLGQFTVYDVAYGSAGIERFAASFVQQGLDFSGIVAPPLYGVIVFNSTFGAGGGVLANDTDAEGDLLPFAVLVSGPSHGQLTWNGDGTFSYTPDADFHGTDTFTYRTGDGRAESNTATVTINVAAVNDAPLITGNDFNADGKADIALQNGQQLAFWLMDGLTIKAESGNLASPLGPGWFVVGAGDFNDNGTDDLLLQNGQQLAIWQMDGTTIDAGSGNIATLGDGWMVADTGDFDGDGNSDILLQKDQDLAIWHMDGTTILPNSGNIGTLGAGWMVAGTGDFNGDTNDDILLQNGQQLAIWQMDGTTILPGSGNVNFALGAGWKVAGVGDATNDNKADIFLQNGQDVALWVMDGTQISAGSGNIATVGAGWTIAGSGDFNDDGFADLLLQNGQDLAEWHLQGTQIQLGSGNIGTLNPDWHLL